MNELKLRLFYNWYLIRIMRLAIGSMMLTMSVPSKDWMLASFGAFFLFQAITDTGCSGTRSCSL